LSHWVWLYHRFPLSFRDVQELMLKRGVDVSYETIRAWCDRFGQEYANQLRRRGPRKGDKWHLDEVFVKINGAQRYLWRAVDQPGNVLEVLVQSRPKHVRRQEGLPPTAQGPAVGAACDRHRQARRLPGGAPRARAVGGPPAV